MKAGKGQNALLILVLILAACFASAGCFGARPGRPDATPLPAESSLPVPSETSPIRTSAPTPIPTRAPAGYPEGIGPYAVKCLNSAAKTMDRVIPFIESNPCPIKSSVHVFVPADKRGALAEDEKAVYDAMLQAAKEFKSLSLSCPNDVMEHALAALKFDHPEIEICFDMENVGGKWRSIYFLPESRYFRPADDIDKVREQVEAFTAVGNYVAYRIPEGFSAIDRYRAIAYFISLNTEYAYVHGEIPRFASTAYGALINGYSICQGYAIGFEYLCRCANVDCRRVRNIYEDDNMHFWDIVTLDQGTYYVDVTWCDGNQNDFRSSNWYKWFMFTAEWQHQANDGSSTTGRAFDRSGW